MGGSAELDEASKKKNNNTTNNKVSSLFGVVGRGVVAIIGLAAAMSCNTDTL